MVDSEYSPEKYKSLKKNIASIIKNPEMLRFVPDHLKLKRCVKMQLKNCRS